MSRRQRAWPARVTVAVILVCVLGGLAWAEADARARSRRDLQEHFAVRAETVEGFLETHVGYLLDRERSLAGQRLGRAVVTQDQFDSYRQTLDFGSAVLLDASGRAIAAAPQQAALIGAKLAAGSADLIAAEEGRRAVSGGSGSPEGSPSVSFVTSFDSAVGPRVVSGSCNLADQPVGSYLQHGLLFAGSAVYLIDSKGEILADSSVGRLEQADSALAGAVAGSVASGTYRTADRALPMSDADGTKILSERVREGIADLLPSQGSEVPVTVSIGAALSERDDDADTLLGRADVALYQAKQSGRNCVVAAAVDPDHQTFATRGAG